MSRNLEVIIRISGGLGNQMFQYAFGRAISLRNNAILKLDTIFYEKIPRNVTRRYFLLQKFPTITLRYADSDDRNRISKLLNSQTLYKIYRYINTLISLNSKYILENNYHDSISDISYYDGYWQSYHYFKNIKEKLYADFDLSHVANDKVVKECKKLISSKFSISMHVRRGDYVSNSATNAYHGVLPKTYYYDAVSYITEHLQIEDVNIFIFSDDIEWCKSNLKFESAAVHFTDNLNEFQTLYLMSECQSQVIANSSFSWWGAFLARNSNYVIYSRNWFSTHSTDNFFPVEWICL